MFSLNKKIIFLLSSILFFTSETQLSAAGQEEIEEQEEDCSNDEKLSLQERAELLEQITTIVVAIGVACALIYHGAPAKKSRASGRIWRYDSEKKIHKFLDQYHLWPFYDDQKAILEDRLFTEDELCKLFKTFSQTTMPHIKNFDIDNFRRSFMFRLIFNSDNKRFKSFNRNPSSNPIALNSIIAIWYLSDHMDNMPIALFREAYDPSRNIDQQATKFAQSFQSSCKDLNDQKTKEMHQALLEFVLFAQISDSCFILSFDV